jgi:hypothetical protein
MKSEKITSSNTDSEVSFGGETSYRQIRAVYNDNDWIRNISDVTDLAHSLCEQVKRGNLTQAESLLPLERPFPVSHVLEMKLGMLEKP